MILSVYFIFQKTTFHLQSYFNDKFEELMRLKSKKMNSVISENARLKFIISGICITILTQYIID